MAIRKWVGYVLTLYLTYAPLFGCYIAVANHDDHGLERQ